jgi:hypothetical protein
MITFEFAGSSGEQETHQETGLEVVYPKPKLSEANPYTKYFLIC